VRQVKLEHLPGLAPAADAPVKALAAVKACASLPGLPGYAGGLPDPLLLSASWAPPERLSPWPRPRPACLPWQSVFLDPKDLSAQQKEAIRTSLTHPSAC
jgi:hypothetical protein